MEIITNPKGSHYYLSNKQLFLMRNDNGGFTNKWMGLWEGEDKLVDSYHYRIRVDDDEYELSNHCEKTVYRGYESEHHYKLPGIQITENAYLERDKKVLVDVLGIRNASPSNKVITINFEMNVNTRNYGENWHDTQYQTNYENYSAHVHVHSGKGDVLYGSTKEKALINFYPLSTYNEYESENDKQRNFRPGAYTAQFELKPGEEKQIPFFIAGSVKGLNKVLVAFVDAQRTYEQEKKTLEKHAKELEKTYSLKAGELEKLAYWSLNTMELLKHADAPYAGLPWFTQHWARDVFWSYKSILCTGDFNYAQDVLKYFSKHRNKTDKLGQIPNQIRLDGEKNYDSLDATTLFTIALLDYVNYSGDEQFLKTNRELVSDLDKWYESNDDNNYLKEDPDKSLTWMDTLKRPRAIENQALYAQACRSMARILEVLKSDKSGRYEKKHEQVRKTIENYWNGEYYMDAENTESLTPNQLVALNNDLIPREHLKNVLEKMTSQEMLTESGLRTLSRNDPEYFAEAYHKGKAWGLTTNWLVQALLKNNDLETASRVLRNTTRNVEEHGIGCLSETFNPDTGEPRDASCQLWSASLVLSVIDEELFGVKPELSKNRVIISPCSVQGRIERYDKRIGDVLMDINLEGKDNEMKIGLMFNRKPDFRVMIQFKNKQPVTLEINHEKNDSYEFTPRLENTVRAVF